MLSGGKRPSDTNNNPQENQNPNKKPRTTSFLDKTAIFSTKTPEISALIENQYQFLEKQFTHAKFTPSDYSPTITAIPAFIQLKRWLETGEPVEDPIVQIVIKNISNELSKIDNLKSLLSPSIPSTSIEEYPNDAAQLVLSNLYDLVQISMQSLPTKLFDSCISEKPPSTTHTYLALDNDAYTTLAKKFGISPGEIPHMSPEKITIIYKDIDDINELKKDNVIPLSNLLNIPDKDFIKEEDIFKILRENKNSIMKLKKEARIKPSQIINDAINIINEDMWACIKKFIEAFIQLVNKMKPLNISFSNIVEIDSHILEILLEDIEKTVNAIQNGVSFTELTDFENEDEKIRDLLDNPPAKTDLIDELLEEEALISTPEETSTPESSNSSIRSDVPDYHPSSHCFFTPPASPRSDDELSHGENFTPQNGMG